MIPRSLELTGLNILKSVTKGQKALWESSEEEVRSEVKTTARKKETGKIRAKEAEKTKAKEKVKVV